MQAHAQAWMAPLLLMVLAVPPRLLGPCAPALCALACVGVIVVMSSSERDRRIVVFPALSSPSTKIRACAAAWGFEQQELRWLEQPTPT